MGFFVEFEKEFWDMVVLYFDCFGFLYVIFGVFL